MENVKLTYQVLIFGGQLWPKLLHTATESKLHAFTIHKLNKQVEKAQKKVGPLWDKFKMELAEKYCEKDEKTGKVVMQHNGLPQPKPECRSDYENALYEFSDQTVELEFAKLPLSFIDHLTTSPMEWTLLEQIFIVNNSVLEEQEKAKKKAANPLHSIQGGA